MRVAQRLLRVVLAPFLWLEEFTVLDPSGKFILWMMIDEEESNQRGERAIVIELADIPDRTIQSGVWAYRDPGYWHCFDSHVVPLSEESVEAYRKQYLLTLGFDPFKQHKQFNSDG